jgi:hypothetical protein
MGRACIFLRVCFIVLIAFSGVLVLTEILGVISYQRHLEDGLDTSYNTYSSIIDLTDNIELRSLVPLIAGIVFLVVWTRKAFKVSEQVPIMQSQRRYSRGWSVGEWFIPFGNLYIPKKVITD